MPFQKNLAFFLYTTGCLSVFLSLGGCKPSRKKPVISSAIQASHLSSQKPPVMLKPRRLAIKPQKDSFATLEEAIQSLVENNLSLKAAEREWKASTIQTKARQWNMWLPGAEWGASAHWDKTKDRNSTQSDSGTVHRTFSTGPTLQYSVFSGGKQLAEWRASQVTQAIKKTDYDKMLLNATHETIHAFGELIVSRESVKMYQALVRSFEILLSEAEARRKAGSATPVDCERMKTHLAEAKAQVIRETLECRKWEDKLFALTQKKPESHLAWKPGMDQPMPAMDTLISLMLRTHPEVKQAIYKEKLKHHELSTAKSAFLPHVQAELSYEMQNRETYQSSDSSHKKEEQLAGLSGKLKGAMPIPINGQAIFGVQMAHLSKQAAAMNRHEIVTDMNHRLKSYYGEWEASQKTCHYLEQQVKAAHLYYAAAQNLFENNIGEQKFSDVIESKRKILEAELSLLKGKIQLKRRYYDLLLLSGHWLGSPHKGVTQV